MLSNVPGDAPLPGPQQTRNAYAELLRDTRGLRREQQQAREAWFARLAADKKDETLFELEILLKGLACFSNPRNHPGAGKRQTIVSLDFREHLAHARDGMARVVQLARALLGDKDRAFVFQRYLETAVPEDITRTKLLHAAMTQETPEGSLFVLRHGFTNLIEISSGLLRLSRLPYRLFYAHMATAMREIAQSAFFNPLAALEFRPEFDRIGSAQVLELIQSVPGEQAHRLTALTFLSLFRMLRYCRLIDAISLDHTDRRVAGRAYLVLAVLRSDARALANFLRRRAGGLLAESYERDLYRVPARDLDARYEELLAEGHRLVGIRGALAGLAANLRLEMRRTFEHDLPAADAGMPEHELRARVRAVVGNVRPALQNGILFLGRSLGVSWRRGACSTTRRRGAPRASAFAATCGCSPRSRAPSRARRVTPTRSRRAGPSVTTCRSCASSWATSARWGTRCCAWATTRAWTLSCGRWTASPTPTCSTPITSPRPRPSARSSTGS